MATHCCSTSMWRAPSADHTGGQVPRRRSPKLTLATGWLWPALAPERTRIGGSHAIQSSQPGLGRPLYAALLPHCHRSLGDRGRPEAAPLLIGSMVTGVEPMSRADQAK
jgi:hypothetical protein